MKRLLLIAAIIIISSDFSECWKNCEEKGVNIETELKKKLFCNYDKTLRPVNDHKTKTMVRVKMIVKSYEFNDRYNTLRVNSWLILRWTDEFLKWDPRDYNKIQELDENIDELWSPDLSLFNADLAHGLGTCHSTNCFINSTGVVVCVKPCTHIGHCKVDFTRWPYDTQNCSFTYGTWMNTGEELDYDKEKTVLQLDDAQESNQWKMISGSVNKSTIYFTTKEKITNTFPSLKFNFIMERHSALQSAIIFGPATVMILINLIVLFIDPHQSERIILSGFNAVTHFLFLQQLYWAIPHNGDSVPNVLAFFRDSLIITTAMLLDALLMKYLIYFEKVPPHWIDATVDTISSNQVAKILIFKKIANNSEVADVEQQQDDDTVLVEELKKPSRQNLTWRKFSRVLDRILSTAILIIYFLMILTLLPSNYLKISDPIDTL